jgi:uncharacterized protein with LGFP repeats
MNYSTYRTTHTNQIKTKHIPFAVAATLTAATAFFIAAQGTAPAQALSSSNTSAVSMAVAQSEIQQRYATDAWFRAQLGAPVGTEYQGADTLAYQNYQNGRAYYKAGFGVHEVNGYIYSAFAQNGAHQGVGVPVTDELTTPDGIGKLNHFAALSNASNVNASIYWSPSTGAHVVKDDIRARWASLGWERSVLGYPVTDQGVARDGQSTYSNFQNGTMFNSPQYGVKYVIGQIYQKWAYYGYDGGFLGKPMTDELVPPDGVGRLAHFEGGSVYWSPSTGAHSVQGAIRDRWASLGWERSYLGYPTSDEYGITNGRRSDFQNGYIIWTPATGVRDYRY